MTLPPLHILALATSFVGVSASHAALANHATSSFGHLPDGCEAKLYTLTSAHGARADITNYGAIVVRLLMPDRTGRLDDVVLGYNRVEDYVKATPYFGAVVGRYGNRIAHGKFTLDGQTYTLATNNSPGGIPCHLHGGKAGFDKVLWSAEPGLVDNQPRLTLRYHSKDGDCRLRFRTHHRPGDGGVDRPTRSAVLLRQLPRWLERGQKRAFVRLPHRLLP